MEKRKKGGGRGKKGGTLFLWKGGKRAVKRDGRIL